MRSSYGRVARYLLAACALSTAGCSKILGLGDIAYVDAPPATDADGGPEPECPKASASTVIACAIVTHIRADGSAFTTRRDLRPFTIAAYIPEGTKSGYRIVSGVASAAGIARIDNVPDGMPYYFRIQNAQDPQYPWPHYFYTDKHELLIGDAEIGRDDTPATSETAVTVNMAGMTPWKRGDSVGLVSFETGTEISLTSARSLIPVGATTMTAAADWRRGVVESTFSDFTDAVTRTAQLIDQSGARSDDLWALHSTSRLAADNTRHRVAVSTIADAVNLTGVKLVSGSPSTIGGTFKPAQPIPSGVIVNAPSGMFRNALRDANRYSDENVVCSLYATPASDQGLVMVGSPLVSIALGRVVATSSGLDGIFVPFTNPFPPSMRPLVGCGVEHTRAARVPGTGRTAFGFSSLTTVTPLPASNTFTFMPPLHTVTNLKIGGVDGLAAGAVPFNAIQPVAITWDPIPGVTHYQVKVRDETVDAFLAVFDTTQSVVLIPADTFTKGNFYAFSVAAIQTSGEYASGKLLDFQAPLWSARIATGMFRFSDLCGNGVPDPGEDCDAGNGVKSLNCDADCTFTACGDGFFNEAAESCDEMSESPHCNAQKCGVPVCGDGMLNRSAGEECDDGNAVRGDGCDDQCKLENCGNNKMDEGEGCDDGNRINGDGCDAFCQPEVEPV